MPQSMRCRYFFQTSVFLFLFCIAPGISRYHFFDFEGIFSLASAEEEEKEDEEEENAYSQKSDSSSKTETITTYETRLIQKKVLVTPPEYRVDTDKDGLVDGIDPDSKVPQQEYFTDTDGDGVPNAFDRHHDEDDWAYVEDTDADADGLLDGYENGYAMVVN